MKPLLRLMVLLLLPALGGCAVAAIPCKVGSAVLDAVPVVGGTAATATDACATAIDP